MGSGVPKPKDPGLRFQTPYLKALSLFPKGDCWNGGGLFTSKNTFWLNDGAGHSALRTAKALKSDLKFQPVDYFAGECPGVYYPRLLSDGWKLLEQISVSEWKDFHVFEKPLDHGWVLRKIAHSEVGPLPVGKGCYWDEHELRQSGSDERIKYRDWEWAEVDRKRLVWAEGGKLFSGRIGRQGLVDEAQLFDFNDMSFERIEAPY